MACEFMKLIKKKHLKGKLENFTTSNRVKETRSVEFWAISTVLFTLLRTSISCPIRVCCALKIKMIHQPIN